MRRRHDRFTPNGLVTLTTDFGGRDGYVGAMKGVMLAIEPRLRLIDVAHDLPPQDVRHGAAVLRAACPRFPAGTVHLAVVDPGVGGDRAAIALLAGGHVFVGPDNGLFSLVVESLGGRAKARRIERQGELAALLPAVPSTTFHGRDVFAPTAAALAAGEVAFFDLGVDHRPVRLATPRSRREGGWLSGEVTHFDRFGNAITSIGRADLPRIGRATVELADGARIRLVGTYAEAALGELVALVGSEGWVEIAVRDGSAREHARLVYGARVRIGPIAKPVAEKRTARARAGA